MKIPKFIRTIMQSDSYTNKNNPDYLDINQEVTDQLRTLFPGTAEFDATGHMIEPNYDMTSDQFNNAKNKIEADFQEAKEEAESEILDEYGEYFDNLGISFDIDEYVELEETIPVRVLYSNGQIYTLYLEIYDLNIPDFEKQNKIWVWHSETDDDTCDECTAMDGQIFFNEDDLPECPLHPNCRCSIEEQEIDENGDKMKSTKITEHKVSENKREEKKEFENKKEKEMMLSIKGIEWLKNLEGNVKVNGKHVIYDDKTKLPVSKDQSLPKGATIGYGHLIQKGEDFSKGLTEEQATMLFQKDLQNTYNTIEKQINSDVLLSMPQNKYDALVSFVFNIGPGSASPQNKDKGLYQSSVRNYLNNENYINSKYPKMELAWKAFNNNGELDNRRDAEWRLFENSDYSGYN